MCSDNYYACATMSKIQSIVQSTVQSRIHSMAYWNGQNCQLKFMVKLLKFSWSKCNNFMLMVCARFHGHGQIPFSCSRCMQDFMVMVRFHFHAHGVCKISWSWSDSIFVLMVCARFHVMVRFHFHAHGVCKISWSWSDSIFMLMVRFHSIMVMVRFCFSCSFFRGHGQQSDSCRGRAGAVWERD